MTWAAVRAESARLLGALTIAEPALDIRTVFEFPPAKVEPGNLPCVILIPPRREQEWGPNQSSLPVYTMRAQFLCRSDQAADAWNVSEAFAEVAMNVNIAALRMNGVDDELSIVHGPQIDEPARMTYGGVEFVGFNMTFEFRFSRFMQGFAA